MQYDQLGRVLIALGAVVLVLGVVFLVMGRSNFLGKLPGDITFSNGNFSCIAPIATMLLLSIVLTIILNVVLRLFNR
jgi:hypothetical protein